MTVKDRRTDSDVIPDEGSRPQSNPARGAHGVALPPEEEHPGVDDLDYEPVSEEEFEQAVKSILLKPIRKQSRWENREPTAKEKSTGFKLVKRK